MMRGRELINKYTFKMEDLFISKGQEWHHSGKVRSEEELKENQWWGQRGKQDDKRRHNEQEQGTRDKAQQQHGEIDEIWNGKGNRRTEGAGSKRKTAGQRLRGQNLEQTRAECIFFIFVLTETYSRRSGARKRGREGKREENGEEGWRQAVRWQMRKTGNRKNNVKVWKRKKKIRNEDSTHFRGTWGGYIR